MLHASHVVACCDGALENYLSWLERQDQQPTHRLLVVGDGDSLSAAVLQMAADMGVVFHREVIHEQEDNDLTKAIRYTLECVGVHSGTGEPSAETIQVDILGATGLREDHTLANISLLGWYLDLFPNVQFRMLTDYGTFLPMQGSRTFASRKGQQVSLFSLTPDVPISVSNLRYPIVDRTLRWWWEGSLNEALSDTFTVHGGRLVVYLCR